MNENFRFLMYRSAEQDISVNAVIRDETVWLTQKAMRSYSGWKSRQFPNIWLIFLRKGSWRLRQLFPKWKQFSRRVLERSNEASIFMS